MIIQPRRLIKLTAYDNKSKIQMYGVEPQSILKIYKHNQLTIDEQQNLRSIWDCLIFLLMLLLKYSP